MLYSLAHLEDICERIFIRLGCSEKDAHIATNTLLSADLRGIDSHGVARLEGYVRLWKKERINTKAEPRIIHQTPSTATLDGDRGLGLVVGNTAMNIAIEKAKQAGTGWVAVKNSNHYGIAGHYAMMPLVHDMIGVSMTNASPIVVPTFGKTRLLGTNPIAFAAPADKEPDFVADFATTVVANGKLELAQRANKNIPKAWAQDVDGNISQDPYAVEEGGALLPLGGKYGGHKGYALGAMVDILSGVLSGAGFASFVPPFVSFIEPKANPYGEGIGHFMGAIRVDAFTSAQRFKEHMDVWIKEFRQSQRVNPEQEVIIPGDPERRFEKQRREEGIPVSDKVVNSIMQISRDLNIEISCF